MFLGNLVTPHTIKVSTRVWLLIDKSALFPHPSQDPEAKKGLRIFQSRSGKASSWSTGQILQRCFIWPGQSFLKNNMKFGYL